MSAQPLRPMLGAVLDALTSERDHRRHDARPSALLRTGATSAKATEKGVALWVRDEYGWSFDWITADPAAGVSGWSGIHSATGKTSGAGIYPDSRI